MRDILKPRRRGNVVAAMIGQADKRAQGCEDLRAALVTLHSAVAELLATSPEGIPPAILERLEAATSEAEAVLHRTRPE